MDNFKKVMTSIGSAVVPVGAAYWTAGTYLHDRLVEMQNTSPYQSLEASLTSVVGPGDSDRLTMAGTVIMSIGLLYLANEIAKPVTRGFAYLYGAKLE